MLARGLRGLALSLLVAASSVAGADASPPTASPAKTYGSDALVWGWGAAGLAGALDSTALSTQPEGGLALGGSALAAAGAVSSGSAAWMAAAEADSQVQGQLDTSRLGYSARLHLSAAGGAGAGWSAFGLGGFATAEAVQLGSITDRFLRAGFGATAPFLIADGTHLVLGFEGGWVWGVTNQEWLAPPLTVDAMVDAQGYVIAGQVAVVSPSFQVRAAISGDTLDHLPTRVRGDLDLALPLRALFAGLTVGSRILWINSDGKAWYAEALLLVGWSGSIAE